LEEKCGIVVRVLGRRKISEMENLKVLRQQPECSLYELASEPEVPVKRIIASTKETRAICNDPFIVGTKYTDFLKTACCKVLREVKNLGDFPLKEHQTTILHILRGGLNFGLREALFQAFGWQCHSSAFISAQRARKSDNFEDWHITENTYQKVNLTPSANIIFGDVVATGTSLEFALTQLLGIVEKEGVAVRSVLFFTIGGVRSEEILASIDKICRERFPNYHGSMVVYFEGRFGVALPETEIQIKITGTDLLRRDALLAPDFVESQYEHPCYPLERCTIYDAGSRAFWIPSYLDDVKDYWELNLVLAQEGLSFEKLLAERLPGLDPKRFGRVDLVALCRKQISKCEELSEKFF